MMEGVNKICSKELEHPVCSSLFNEVKQKLQLLRECGVSETEIASLLYKEEPLSRMIISKDYRIYLGEERKEVHMEPILKAVYLLFLKHPEGIVFKYLPDYRQELAGIYNKIRPWGLTDRAIRSIEDVTNPLLNSINEKCSRVKAAFSGSIDDALLSNYIITGKSGEPKKILLSRDLVTWEK